MFQIVRRSFDRQSCRIRFGGAMHRFSLVSQGRLWHFLLFGILAVCDSLIFYCLILVFKLMINVISYMFEDKSLTLSSIQPPTFRARAHWQSVHRLSREGNERQILECTIRQISLNRARYPRRLGFLFSLILPRTSQSCSVEKPQGVIRCTLRCDFRVGSD